MDDRTVGLVIRALRRRRKWRQVDLARESQTSQPLISRIERGDVAEVTVEALRTIFLALDARLALAPSWRGAELDRLLDEDHAAAVAAVARRLEGVGWTAALEVSYSEYGERGSIDVLGVEPSRRAAMVIEVKTDIASAEALGRKLDEKARLAPKIVRDRFGWTPVVVGRAVALPESQRLRRLIERQPVLLRMFPAGSREVRKWLRHPGHTIAGLWFLSDISLVNSRAVRTPRIHRSRVPLQWLERAAGQIAGPERRLGAPGPVTEPGG